MRQPGEIEAKLAKQKRFTRDDVLLILNLAEASVGMDSYSSILDLKEDLGFDRNAAWILSSAPL